ncbi:MAG: hypothetical protein PHO32_03480 [Candidatus Cloacimonetes bacterium]|nr:hypothetical protein [Candidatus Cloacimonadota bacterium]
MKRFLLIFSVLTICTLAHATSKGKMFVRSLVVPGYSQVASGNNYGYLMMASEISIIGGMLYVDKESKLLLDESYEYAIKFAHVNPGNYDSQFYYNLSRFESSGFDANGYNAKVRKEAMELFPYDPIAQQSYIDDNSYGDDRYWNWDDPTNRSSFNKMRNKSQDYESYAKVAIGVLILNHLVSGIDILRYSEEEQSTNVYFQMKNSTPMMFLNYKW